MIKIKKYKDTELNLTHWNIYITRGDSGFVDLVLLDKDGEQLNLTGDEVIRLHVREMPNGGEILFDGDVELSNDGYAIWHIHPDDTKYADEDKYYWDAQLETTDGDVFTFVPVSDFILLQESTVKTGG